VYVSVNYVYGILSFAWNVNGPTNHNILYTCLVGCA